MYMDFRRSHPHMLCTVGSCASKIPPTPLHCNGSNALTNTHITYVCMYCYLPWTSPSIFKQVHMTVSGCWMPWTTWLLRSTDLWSINVLVHVLPCCTFAPAQARSIYSCQKYFAALVHRYAQMNIFLHMHAHVPMCPCPCPCPVFGCCILLVLVPKMVLPFCNLHSLHYFQSSTSAILQLHSWWSSLALVLLFLCQLAHLLICTKTWVHIACISIIQSYINSNLLFT